MTGPTPDQRAELDAATGRYREAVAALLDQPQRVGHTIGSTAYIALGAASYKQDHNIGVYHTPEAAERAVSDHNTMLDLAWLLRNRLDVRLTPGGMGLILLDEEGRHVAAVEPQPGHGLPELFRTARRAAEAEGYAP